MENIDNYSNYKEKNSENEEKNKDENSKKIKNILDKEYDNEHDNEDIDFLENNINDNNFLFKYNPDIENDTFDFTIRNNIYNEELKNMPLEDINNYKNIK